MSAYAYVHAGSEKSSEEKIEDMGKWKSFVDKTYGISIGIPRWIRERMRRYGKSVSDKQRHEIMDNLIFNGRDKGVNEKRMELTDNF